MKQKHIFHLLLVGLFALPGITWGQDPNLANQYFVNGEYEKASSLYKQLFERDNRNEYFLERYVDCMVNLEEFEECENVLKKQIKKSKQNTMLYAMYGGLLGIQGKEDEAKKQYEAALDKMSPDYMSVTRLASFFVKKSNYEMGIKTYERGSKMLGDPNRFAFSLGELYRRQGDIGKMIEYYLNTLESDPSKIFTVQSLLSRYLAPDDFSELQMQLYGRIQDKENPDLIEMLAWSFVTQKDFKSALRQYKALDKRLNEMGNRVMKLARDAASNKDYDTAIEAYEYIIKEKGSRNVYFFDAKRDAMECRRKKITEGYAYTDEDLRILEAEYESFLSSYGKGKQTAEIVLQLAELEAYYINNLDKAIALLEDLKSSPGLHLELMARVKINLADYYLISGDIWESTLLYSQVDKSFKEGVIGQEARFKNARLSYFNGDFQWAQAQFDVLKASTSKLISNDALDLSVFIMDNLNLDTTSAAISLYSGAELLIYQNKFDEAFLKLDTLKKEFPEHMLQDDILYLEAQVHKKKREYEEAVKLYAKIVEKFPEDIRADNALYEMAKLYEIPLNNKEKAKELYEKMFLEYSGSVYAVDSRKRFRILRGDDIQ